MPLRKKPPAYKRTKLAQGVSMIDAPHSEIVVRDKFFKGFAKYIRKPEAIAKDVETIFRSREQGTRHNLYLGTLKDKYGREHKVVLKEFGKTAEELEKEKRTGKKTGDGLSNDPRYAKFEFDAYYQMLTGKKLLPESRLVYDHEGKMEVEEIDTQKGEKRYYEFKGKGPKGELLKGKLVTTIKIQPSARQKRIHAPSAIGYVIDKKNNRGYMVYKYVKGKAINEMTETDLELNRLMAHHLRIETLADLIPKIKDPKRREDIKEKLIEAQKLKIQEMKAANLAAFEKKRILKKTAKMAKTLYQRAIYHGDFRPRNVLASGKRIVLIDPELTEFYRIIPEGKKHFDKGLFFSDFFDPNMAGTIAATYSLQDLKNFVFQAAGVEIKRKPSKELRKEQETLWKEFWEGVPIQVKQALESGKKNRQKPKTMKQMLQTKTHSTPWANKLLEPRTAETLAQTIPIADLKGVVFKASNAKTKKEKQKAWKNFLEKLSKKTRKKLKEKKS